MSNKLTSIIYELPDEEDITNSFRTPKGNSNRSIKMMNEDIFLSKTEIRGLQIKNNDDNNEKLLSARIQKSRTRIEENSSDFLFKTKPLTEESAFLPKKADSIDNNEFILGEGKMSYQEIYSYFSSLNFENEKKNLILEDYSNLSFCHKLCIKLTKKNVLATEKMKKEREIIFCISEITYDEQNEKHKNLLEQLFVYFTNEETCPSSGVHWEKLGFQDNTPKKDLRGTGMLCPLQVLYFIEKFPKSSQNLYNFLKEKKVEWLFFVSLLQFTKNTIDLLRNMVLIIFCNRNKSVVNTLNEFFCGLVCYFYSEISYEQSQELTAEIISAYVNRTKLIALNNPNEILWKSKQVKLGYESELSNSS